MAFALVPGRVTVLVSAMAVACSGSPRSAGPGPEGGHGDQAATSPLSQSPRYSQGKEELIVRDFFHDRHHGFFLDVGCAAPIVDSNTYYLEKHLEWSGIGVDALPEFTRAWQAKRPRSRFFNYLVTDHVDAVEPFYRADLRGISSGRKDQIRGPAGKPRSVQEIAVATITLTALLERSGVSAIDFLSMDIEGGELLALAGFDIERFHPAFACIEAKPANRDPLLAYFAAHGYERVDRYLEYDTRNYYFTPRPPR